MARRALAAGSLPKPQDRLFAGTSGWAYPTWKPGFYPEGTSAKKFLGFYASKLNSVEVNYTFREAVTAEQLAGWIAQTPPGFRFSFKAPQRITHFSRLRECDGHVAEFFESLAPVRAAEKLGMVMFQLPPNLKADLGLLANFLDAPGFAMPEVPPVCFEFRHESWFTDAAADLLRKRNHAFCIAETDDLMTPEIHTASTHACFRLRKGGGYKPREIAAFVERMKPLAAEREVYVHFRHEDEPTGALNAVAFLRKATR